MAYKNYYNPRQSGGLKKKKTTTTTTTTPKTTTTSTTTSTNTTGTTTSKTPSYTDEYKNYINNLQAQKQNVDNQIAIAQQNTQKYIDNYTKAQGLYGSGIGASITTGTINQANQLKTQNVQNFNQALNEYNQQYNTQMQQNAANKIENLANAGKTKEEIQKYIADNYGSDKALTSTTQQYINDYLESLGNYTTWSDQKKQTVNELASAIQQITDPVEKEKIQQIATNINNATTLEEYNKALSEYETYLTNLELGGSSVEEVINPESSGTYVSISDINSTNDFYNKLNLPNMVGKNSNIENSTSSIPSSQDAYINRIISKAKEGNLENNVVIDVNKGFGKTYVFYSNGKFYYLGGSIPDNYKDYKKLGSWDI